MEGTLKAVLEELPISQEIGQNTRVSIIAYDTSAHVLGDLHSYNNNQDITCHLCSLSISNVDEVDIRNALMAAVQVYKDSHDRQNVHNVLMFFASAYR